MAGDVFVTIAIINYNGRKYLRRCLEAVQRQTYDHTEVILIDNGSSDGSATFVEEHYQWVHVHRECNVGYSAGCNTALRMARGKYLLILNPDAFPAPSYLSELVRVAEGDPRIGALCGKLLHYSWDRQQPSGLLDSTGLQIFRSRRVIDRGQGELDLQQYDEQEEVFGVTGAAPVYRVEALHAVAVDGEVFDEDFFAYKEDIDISWRLRLMGWTIWYVPATVAWHCRQVGRQSQHGFRQLVVTRRRVSSSIRAWSQRNDYLMLLKNEIPILWARHFAFILVRHLGLLAYIILFERDTLSFIPATFRLLPKIWNKRKVIHAQKTVAFGDLQRWFQ